MTKPVPITLYRYGNFEFHQYLKAGRSASEALALAQRDIIVQNLNNAQVEGIRNVEMPEHIKQAISKHNDASSRNPYYWGPFVLIGNGSVKITYRFDPVIVNLDF